MIRLGHAHIFERCGGSSSDAMLWPSKNAPILVYLIILSHGRSRLWRATSTLVIQGIMIRSWFCSRPRRRLSRTTRRTDYGHPPKFRGFSRLLIRQFHQSLFRYGIHTLAKWSLGRTEEVSYICFRMIFFQKIKILQMWTNVRCACALLDCKQDSYILIRTLHVCVIFVLGQSHDFLLNFIEINSKTNTLLIA